MPSLLRLSQQIYHRWGSVNRRVLLTVLEAGHPRTRHRQIQRPVRTQSLVHKWHLVSESSQGGRGRHWSACVCVLRHAQLFANPWTAARQASLPMEFSRQEYRSRFPFPSVGNLPDSGIKPGFPVSPALAGGFFPLFHLGNRAGSLL